MVNYENRLIYCRCYAGWPQSLQAQVRPKVEYDYYDVAAKEGGDLWKKDQGRLGWELSTSFKPRRNMYEVCRVMKYEVTLKGEITLPKFKSKDAQAAKAAEAVTESLKKNWRFWPQPKSTPMISLNG